ncbi:MAG: hypothetical protein JRH20_04470 [Deltaproteobacteria bacterium]|nr:hypothetical protein [Deltaproteobacteria bacterium]
MTKTSPIYSAFLGTWVLDPKSCNYQQGEAPQAGTYEIGDNAGRLEFVIRWSDAEGSDQEVAFGGAPDGVRVPFAGGDLADALAVEATSPRELTSSAYWRGKERMVAQRQLDATGMAMRVTQVVFLPDGSHLANVSVYRRVVRN